jgi:hypothetical protein
MFSTGLTRKSNPFMKESWKDRTLARAGKGAVKLDRLNDTPENDRTWECFLKLGFFCCKVRISCINRLELSQRVTLRSGQFEICDNSPWDGRAQAKRWFWIKNICEKLFSRVKIRNLRKPRDIMGSPLAVLKQVRPCSQLKPWF